MSHGPSHLYSGNLSNFALEVAEGKVQGVSAFEKFGRAKGINTADAPKDLWHGPGIYTGFPVGVSEPMEIRSDNIADAAAGTGARTVEVSKLLDANFNEMPPVTVTLDGTNWVSLGATEYHRASRIKVRSAGSGGSNVGVITLRHSVTTANIFTAMPVGNNQTSIMAASVPADKVLLLDFIIIDMSRLSGAAGSAEVALKVRNLGEVFRVVKDLEITTGDSYSFGNNGFVRIEAKSDFKLGLLALSDNGTSVSAEVSGYLIDAD